MTNIWQIIRREYLVRVKKRTFLLTTFLTPILIVLFGVVLFFILAYESNESPKMLVMDQNSDLILQKDLEEYKINAELTQRSLNAIRSDEEKDYAGLVNIPKVEDIMTEHLSLEYYSDDALAPDVASKLELLIEDKLRQRKVKFLGYDDQKIKALETRIKIESKAWSDDDTAIGPLNSSIAAALGMAMGFIMYFAVSIYGSMVMRGVMEEKINRIVEVMISSVKPFELMLGKVLGIGAVGITQLLIWIVFFPLLSLIANLFFSFNPEDIQQLSQSLPNSDMEAMVMDFSAAINNINWTLILPSFLVFFICGYMLYAALFAAVGSAVGDDMGEAQSLTVPIMLPIVFGIYIMITAVRNPSSPLAVWSSIIPFFSPMVMPARLAFNPPMWQLILSIVLLILTVVAVIYISGRIYRVGILMYGKKASFKELWRWLMRND